MLVQISGTSTEEERLLQKQNARSVLAAQGTCSATATTLPRDVFMEIGPRMGLRLGLREVERISM